MARAVKIRQKLEGAYRHGDLKTAMKVAALRLVKQKGPRGFSINEASRLAGVTVAAPYRHFTDKEGLLVAIALDGNEILLRELTHSISKVSPVKSKMIEAGMAYLRFSSNHADYFAVMFGAGLDREKYPVVEETLCLCFNVILDLSLLYEKTPEAAAQRAVSAWGLVHGLATLTADGSLGTNVQTEPDFEHFRPLLLQFLRQPYEG